MLDQFASATISKTWAQHSKPDQGTDFRFAAGTAIKAPFAGTLRNIVRAEPAPFKSLYIAVIDSDRNPAVSMEYMHLSKFAEPGHYVEGATIGTSGGYFHALGAGRSTGPHIHVASIINGTLRPYSDAFSTLASLPAHPTQEDDTMPQILNLKETVDGKTDTASLYYRGAGGMKGIASTDHLALLTRYVKVVETGSYDHFYPIQRLVIEYYDAPPATAPIDVAGLTAAIVAGVTPHLSAAAGAGAVATAVEAALLDNLAALPAQLAKATNDDLAARLAG